MNFAGAVHRVVPAKAHPLHLGFILHARGRWNREKLYGCLYTSLSADGALAERAKYLRSAGFRLEDAAAFELVSLEIQVEPVLDLTSPAVRRRLGVQLATLTGDAPEDLDACRAVADLARQEGYNAILSPSAALQGAVNLNLYINGRADQYVLNEGTERISITPDLLRPFY